VQNKIKPIWLVLSGVATIAVGYGVYRWLTKDGKSTLFSMSKTIENGFCKYSGFPLRFATCGEHVKVLQRYLNSKIRSPRVSLKQDGKMGSKTVAELKRIEGISSVSESKFNQLKVQLNPFTKSII